MSVSFDLYHKVYKYDGYAVALIALEDEDVLDDLDDLDGAGIFKQSKAKTS